MIALTPRQRQVLAYLALGFEPAQIAGIMGVSKRTVDYHLAEVYTRSKPRSVVIGGVVQPLANRTALYHRWGFWGLAPQALLRIAKTGEVAS